MQFTDQLTEFKRRPLFSWINFTDHFLTHPVCVDQSKSCHYLKFYIDQSKSLHLLPSLYWPIKILSSLSLLLLFTNQNLVILFLDFTKLIEPFNHLTWFVWKREKNGRTSCENVLFNYSISFYFLYTSDQFKYFHVLAWLERPTKPFQYLPWFDWPIISRSILSLKCAGQSWAAPSFLSIVLANHEPYILSLHCADQSWAQHPFSQLCWPIMSPTFFFSIVLTNQMPAISFLIFQLINLKLLSLYPSVFILTMLVPWWNSRIRGRWLAYPDQASSCTLPTGQSGLSCIKGLLTYGPPAITGLSWLNW